jgi:hypothetical protein
MDFFPFLPCWSGQPHFARARWPSTVAKGEGRRRNVAEIWSWLTDAKICGTADTADAAPNAADKSNES